MVSRTLFERTWTRAQRWALVLTRPGVLPATAQADRYVDAVLGMERVGRNAEAAAYRAARQRWPDNLVAWLGEGNAQYAQGNFAAAEEVYREGLTYHPNAAALYNNRAEALAAQGDCANAITAAARVVELNGAATYRATLDDLRQRRCAAAIP